MNSSRRRSIFGKLSIHCAQCGALVEYHAAWRSGLGSVYVCGKTCHDVFELAYARMILGKDQEPSGPPEHFVSGSCAGEICAHCGQPATHKVGEEILPDDPYPICHNRTSYICCDIFRKLFCAQACK